MSIIELNPSQPNPANPRRDPASIDWDRLLCTVTGEPFQLIRFYGTIHNTKIWQGRFKRLKSIQPLADRDRWQWLYRHEAKDIKFPLAAQDIPKPYRPAVLATMASQGNELMLEVHSVERAIALAVFLMDKLKPQVFEFTRVRIVNQFFNVDEATDPFADADDDRPAELRFNLDIEALFNPPDLQQLSDQVFEERVKEITSQYLSLIHISEPTRPTT